MEILKKLLEVMNQKEAINTVVLDMRKTSMPADFFVIATANSQTHMNTLRDAVVEFFLGNNHALIYFDKGEGYDWLLIDAGDIVVHIFTAHGREFYDLEGFWSDAAKLFQA